MKAIAPLRSTALCLVVAGCAMFQDGRVPTSAELVGIYDYGHTGFDETLELRADGTYQRFVAGHLGFSGVADNGTWRVAGNLIKFTPAPGKQGHAGPTTSEAFFYRRLPAFAPLENVKSNKVGVWFVYLRRAEASTRVQKE